MSGALDLSVREDKEAPGDWHAEYFDDDGGCFVTIFSGPHAEARARDYHAALRNGLFASHVPPAGEISRGQ
jgi:hypothetical protein